MSSQVIITSDSSLFAYLINGLIKYLFIRDLDKKHYRLS